MINRYSVLPDKMRAITIANGPTAETLPRPLPVAGEALIRVSCVGICGTDLALFNEYTDFRGIPGHEFAGTVLESENQDLVGKRVTASINLIPGREYFDWREAKHHPKREAIGIRKRNGAMAEYITLPIGCLHIIPDRVDDFSAAMAEPLAAAIDAVHRLPDDSSEVLLLGDGKLAQFIGRVLIVYGRKVYVLGKSQDKCRLMKNSGAEILTDLSRKFNSVIEATGNPQGFSDALDKTAPQGTLVIKSTYPENVEINLSRVVVDEINIRGSRCGDIEAALDMIESGRIYLNDLVSAEFSLEEAEAAFECARDPESLKVMIRP